MRAAQDKQDWLYASKDYTGQRFVDLRQITPKNAGQLRAACIYRSNNAGATQTNLLVYKGVMYLTIDKAIVAIDAATCRERWTYNWEGKGAVLSATNRGVALKDGRVVRGTADGYLIAAGHGQRHAALEPEDRRCEVQPVSQHATADLRGSGDLRPSRCRLGCEELDRCFQARDRRAGLALQSDSRRWGARL